MIKIHQVEIILQYLDDYLDTVRNEDDSVESAMDRINKRKDLKNYILQVMELKEEN
mgnify:CR=1 FL=1